MSVYESFDCLLALKLIVLPNKNCSSYFKKMNQADILRQTSAE